MQSTRYSNSSILKRADQVFTSHVLRMHRIGIRDVTVYNSVINFSGTIMHEIWLISPSHFNSRLKLSVNWRLFPSFRLLLRLKFRAVCFQTSLPHWTYCYEIWSFSLSFSLFFSGFNIIELKTELKLTGSTTSFKRLNEGYLFRVVCTVEAQFCLINVQWFLL